MQNMKLQTAIDEFLIEQRIRGNTEKTVQYYSICLSLFSRFAGSDIPLMDIDLKCLRGYYMALSGHSLATTTVQTYVRALRSFLRWCYDEELTSVNLAEKFRLPKAQRKTIDVLTDLEVQRLFACFNCKRYIQLRNYCIVSLMLDSGLRLHEVVSLTLEHVHIAEGYIIVDGKGQKQRVVPIGLNTRKALSRYLSRRPGCARSDQVFLKSDLDPISDATIRQLFRKLKKQSGIPRLRAHLLRHTFATRYLENGGDMYALQQILGHTSLEMVKKYVHSTTRKIVPNFSKYSPVDNLMHLFRFWAKKNTASKCLRCLW